MRVLILSISLCLASIANATMVTLDFQSDINAGRLHIGDVMTDQFAELGVTFMTQGSTGPVADGFGTPWTRGLFNSNSPNTPFVAIFSVPVTTISFHTIAGSPLSVTAYNRFNEQLAVSSINGIETSGLLGTSRPINYVSFLNNSGTGYEGRSDLTILGSLAFGTIELAPVPLPSGLLLFPFGLILLARLVHFKH